MTIKKFLLKSVATIIALSMIAVTYVPASAISESCVSDHFKKLNYSYTKKIATPPSENTCPYVAMSMLLTFYDSYWNEMFVPDEYEWDYGIYNNDTDKLDKTFNASSEAAAWEEYKQAYGSDNSNSKESTSSDNDTSFMYREYALNNTNSFFEPYLISLGMELGFHNNPHEYLGLATQETAAVLEYYLYSKQGFSRSQITVNCLYGEETEIAQKVAEKTSQGFPLIYSGKKIVSDEEQKNNSGDNTTTLGHALIAYGMDANGDVLLHTGWKDNEYRTINTCGYTMNMCLIWLEINEENLPHSHSYNYINNVTNEPLCSCQIYSTHPLHNQNHKYFLKTDFNNQRLECACGDFTILHTHEKSYRTLSSLEHFEECNICDYSMQTVHEYHLEYFTQDYHRDICNCGMSLGISEHEYHLESIDDNNHQNICACGNSLGITEHEYQIEYLNTSYHKELCACGNERNLSVHSVSRYRNKTKQLHEKICECGYVIGTSRHTIVNDNNKFSHCTGCGAVFNNITDFIPIVQKKDPEYENE